MNDLAVLLAQGMGSGRLPYAPGTWGTFFFIFIAWPLLSTPIFIQWLITFSLIIGKYYPYFQKVMDDKLTMFISKTMNFLILLKKFTA